MAATYQPHKGLVFRAFYPTGSHHNEEFEIQDPGVQSWSALPQQLEQWFVQDGLLNQRNGQSESIGIDLGLWALDQLEPNKTVITDLQQILRKYKRQVLDICLQDLGTLQCSVWSITPHTSKILRDVSDFWDQPQVQPILNKFINQIEISPLRTLMTRERCGPEDLITLQQPGQAISQLWADLRECREQILELCFNHPWDYNGLRPSYGDLVMNPVTLLIERLVPPAQGGVYAVGAGQMLSLLDLTRQLIDQAVLPLNTPLLADNRSFHPVVELNCTGQRRSILNELWVNPPEYKPIAVYNDRLRLPLINQYQPRVIFLNVKTNVLQLILNEDFCETLAALPITPVLVMPSKSYTSTGEIPYKTTYECLRRIKPELAQNLTTLGGFYAAPSILTGDFVHFTLAAEHRTACVTLARMFVDSPPEKDGIIFCKNNIHLDIQTGQIHAQSLMAGGAHKNFLTYLAARKIMRAALTIDRYQPQWLHSIDEQINHQLQCNRAQNVEITGWLAHEQHVKPSAGLLADFQHCLPLSGHGIATLVRHIDRLQKHILRAPNNKRALIAKRALHEVIKQVQQDRQHLLGTRNARDGFIDEILSYTYERWRVFQHKLPITLTFPAYYLTFYPRDWRGSFAQEGRIGIIPAVARASLVADQKQTPIPKVLTELWHSYFQHDRPTIKGLEWHRQLHHLLQWILYYGEESESFTIPRIREWFTASQGGNTQQWLDRMISDLNGAQPSIDWCRKWTTELDEFAKTAAASMDHPSDSP